MDIVKIALVLNIIAVVIALVTDFIIAWENAGSRNLALAGGAFFAASILFLIQLPFEFREDRDVALISAELTIDKTKPEIRQWEYSFAAVNNRVSIEVDASSWLADNNPEIFSEDPHSTQS